METLNDYIKARLTKWDKFKQYFFAAPAIVLFLTIVHGFLALGGGEPSKFGIGLFIILFPIAIISYNSTIRKITSLKEEWYRINSK